MHPPRQLFSHSVGTIPNIPLIHFSLLSSFINFTYFKLSTSKFSLDFIGNGACRYLSLTLPSINSTAVASEQEPASGIFKSSSFDCKLLSFCYFTCILFAIMELFCCVFCSIWLICSSGFCCCTLIVSKFQPFKFSCCKFRIQRVNGRCGFWEWYIWNACHSKYFQLHNSALLQTISTFSVSECIFCNLSSIVSL